MMKLRAVDKFGVKIAVAEKCGMASGANVMVVVGWAAGDLVRVSEFGCIGCIAVVDRRHLIGVDRDLAGEAGATRQPDLVLETLAIAEVGRERVDRLHARRVRAEEAGRPREQVGEVVLAILGLLVWQLLPLAIATRLYLERTREEASTSPEGRAR